MFESIKNLRVGEMRDRENKEESELWLQKYAGDASKIFLNIQHVSSRNPHGKLGNFSLELLKNITECMSGQLILFQGLNIQKRQIQSVRKQISGCQGWSRGGMGMGFLLRG